MKIDVIIPSRGRAQMMQASICTLNALESGNHAVRYTVLCDDDDPSTKAAAHSITGINLRVLQRPRCVMNAWENEVIAESDADAFMPWPDDYTGLALNWDEIVSFALGKVPAFSWKELQDPENHTTIVLAREWVQAAGKFFPDRFPFWFGDTWLKEVFGFVYGANMPIIDQLPLSHKRTPTTNMRDLDFWFRVFAHTRYERIEDAKRIANVLKQEWVERPALIARLEEIDAAQLARVPKYEEMFGANSGEPSAAYLEAKAKAERLFSVKHAFAEAA